MSFSDWKNAKYGNTSNKKKKKDEEKYASFSEWKNAKYGVTDDDIAYVESQTDYEDIAPVREENPSWFQKGAFEDGYQFGDVVKTIVGTLHDGNENITTAVFDATENLIDTAAYGVGAIGSLFDKDFDDEVGNFIAKEILTPKESGEVVATYGNPTGWLNLLVNGGDTEGNSVLGDKSDGLVQSGAHLVGSYALQYLGVPAWLTQGVNAFGSEIESAYQNDATPLEAGISGALSAAAEVAFEKLSSGIKFKSLGGTADGWVKQFITDKISNKIGRTVAKYASDVVGEGVEEVATEFVSAVGKYFTYMDDKEFNEIFSTEDAFDAFIGGVVMGGVAGGGRVINSAKTGRDYTTGLTDSEERVVNKYYEDAIAEKENSGTKLHYGEKAKIYDGIIEQMATGQLNIDTIEEVLGGKTYEEYKSATDKENALKTELKELSNMKSGDMTRVQQKRLAELEAMNLDDTTKRDELRKALDDKLAPMIENSKLAESYNEKARKSQAFEADLTKYTGKQKEAVQRAVDSGVLNNSFKSHQLVDTLSKIEADKGITIDYADNEKLKEFGYYVEGKTVNGVKTGNGFILNVQGAKAWQSTVGHEIAHILEGTGEAYNNLRSELFAFAESKGELQSRRASLTELYKGMDADIDAELTADLLGDYLFTDKNFINKLSSNRNLFQKIYDEIKYLWNVATGKQKAEIEKVKKAFDEAWKELSVKDNKKTTAKTNGDTDVGIAADGSVSFSISETTDGRFVAVVDSDILEGIDTTSWNKTKKETAKKAASKALKQFSEGIVVDGVTRKVNRTSRREYTRSEDTEKLYRNAPDVFADKMRVADIADDIVVATTNWNRDGGLVHPREDNFVDFDHGTTLIMSGSSKYIAEVVVGITQNGDAVFYDVVNMTPTTFEIKNAETSTTATTQNAIGDINEISTNDILPQNSKNVNTKFSLSEDSQGNELSLAVQKRFANSKAVDENGNLKVLYHGTYNGEFYTFDKSKGSVEGDFGSGFYFTDNEYDVSDNYEGGGADFENKVARRAEQIEAEEEIEYHEAEKRAREELYKGSFKHTVYVNIENPAIVGETNLLDPDKYFEEYDREDYDSDEDYEGEVEQLIADDIDKIIWDVDRNVDVYTTDGLAEVLWNAVNEGGIDIEQLKANINNLYLEDSNGNMVGNEVTRQIIESLGYDGIIDNTVSTKFNMNLEEGTTHYIVFKPNQIKSIDNQNPTDNPDIRYSLSEDSLYNSQNLVYNGERGEGYVRTDEFRNLQTECQRMSDKDIQLYHSGNKQIDAELRANLARILRTQVDTYRNGLRYDNGILNLANKGNEFNMCKSVDGSLFHDVFEIAQKHLRNGELVDLHTVETTDDGIGYNDCYNYLSDDGLSGFSITPEGDLISVFNASDKKGFLGAIAPFVKENAKTLDCYNSPNQPLREMYEAMFGFKTASIMDYNMEYDHDNIAENHGMPQIAFMVNTDSEVVTREFTKDEYDEAVEYRNKFVNPENTAPVKNSLSNEGEEFAPLGNFSTPLKDLAIVKEDTAPVNAATEDIAPVQGKNVPANDVAEDVAPVFDEITPMTEEEANAVQEEKMKFDAKAEGEPKTRKQLHTNIINDIKATFSSNGFEFDDVLENAKNLSTFSTVDNTPQRVMEKALGYKEGQVLSDLTVNKVAQNETEGIKWLNSFTDRESGLLAQFSKQYNIKPGSKESAAAQMYAEGFYVNDDNEIIAYGDAELAQDFPDATVRNNIKGLANDPRIRQIYDETLDAINKSRTRNAYPEIQRLDNYFLHFRAMEDTFSKIGLPFNPNDIRAKDLPTDLNGVTADLKPGQPYFASAMHRKGKRTSFDLLGGLERYLTSAKNQIYHIDDIQTLRALRNYIADTYGQAHGLDGLDMLTEEEAQERIKEVYGSHLSTFAKFLNEEANVLAGKTALIDRGLEGILGRRGMTFLDTLNKQVGSNLVGYSASSAIVNFDAIPRAVAKSNKFDFLKAFTQFASNKVSSIYGKSDGFAENSPVIIRRKGADRFYRTPFQKVADAGYVLMSAVDNISTELIARTKYNECIRKGMDEQQAHFETDKWVSRLMGDRSLGQMPQIYNSKALGLITKFQFEVRNNLDSQFYDTIQEAKVSNEEIQNGLARNAKTAAKITSTFVQLAVAQHLFGKAFESIAGYNPAFDIISVLATMFGFDDDEESEDTVLDNIEQGFLELLEDLPYTSTFTGGRIPISNALPIKELIKGEDSYGNEKSRLETLAEVAPYYVLPGGYGQIKKTVQGLGMFSDDHPVSGSYTDSGNLRFPVEDTPLNRVQAAIFGQYASENAREYFDNDYAPLKKKQIQEYIDVDMPIKDYWEYREGLAKQETLEEKFDYIAGLDLPVYKKNILINNVVDRKDEVNLEGYEDFANYEEYDYAVKNPEKYAFSKAVGGYSSYVTYSSDLNDIKADKDAYGKSISGSRKQKVLDYINNLDADYYTKIILYKSEYPSDDTYNMEIIDYLNSREDITYDDMVSILTYLDFTVDAEGNIYWN